jgi:hypothetical protein
MCCFVTWYRLYKKIRGAFANRMISVGELDVVKSVAATNNSTDFVRRGDENDASNFANMTVLRKFASFLTRILYSITTTTATTTTTTVRFQSRYGSFLTYRTDTSFGVRISDFRAVNRRSRVHCTMSNGLGFPSIMLLRYRCSVTNNNDWRQ